MALAKTYCPAVAIYDAAFSDVDAYYRMFPHEMSDSRLLGLDIQDYRRLPKITFQSLLETMRDSLRAHPQWDDFLVVAHGLHNEMDYASGLTMPLAPHCTMKTVVDILRPLLDFMNKGAAQEEIDAFETGHDIKINGVKPTLAAGSLRTIVNLMRELRTLKVRRVEFRACTLGTNVDALGVLGQCLSALWASAPDEHMFYGRVNPGTPVRESTLQKHLIDHNDARVFTDNGESFAFQVQGREVFRHGWAETTTKDLGWFVDKYIWDGNKYPRGGGRPAPFVLAGMDLFGSKRYALPQEPEYAKHIIFTGPLPGNKI